MLVGGDGGGGSGSGSNADTATAGSVNTGSGGGGGGSTPGVGNSVGKNGGSGIVIIKYPDSYTLTIGAGLTSSTSTSGGFKITSFTAGSDTISFA